MISNIDDIKVRYKRKDMEGVVCKYGSRVDFVSSARDLLVDVYRRDGLGAHVVFSVTRICNDWTFEPLFECPLNFASFTFDEHTASCGCLDSSADAVIKSGKGVVHEYAVSELKEALPLDYDGVQMQNDATFQIIGRQIEGQSKTEMQLDRTVWWYIPRLGIVGDNLVNNKSILVSDQEEAFQTDGPDSGWGFPSDNVTGSCFAECLKDCTVTVDFSDFFIKDSSKLCFMLCKISGGAVIPLSCGYSNVLALDSNTRISSVKWSGSLKEGEKLQYAVFNHERIYGRGSSFFIMPQNGVMKWMERSGRVDMDVIRPSRLLDKILASMSGGERLYGGIKETVLEDDPVTRSVAERENSRLANTLLVASDSIRNLKDAKIRTSFDDFCKFMEAEFGYVYEILMRPKGSGIPEYILANSYDFNGMTELYHNITSVDSKNAVIHFSTTDKAFVGVVYESSMRDCSKSFPGFERYQTYIEGEGYKVNTDRYYHDTADDVYYSATVKEHVSQDTGSRSWKAELHECIVDGVSSSMFAGTHDFGGIVSDVASFSDVPFAGTFDSSCVMYVRRKRMFVYVCDGTSYQSFPESGEYNLSQKARKDVLYSCGGQKYCVMGTALMKCSVSDTAVNLVPFVMFRHRSELFRSDEVRKIRHTSGFGYRVSERMYSQIEIGYSKQDYDLGNNGKDEINFSSTYTTGNMLSESKLSLISPYRADSYGFEEIASKRGEDVSSTSSDGAVFAVFCDRHGSRYEVSRTVAIAGVNSASMFNAVLSPLYMIDANMGYLASYADNLKFASSEGFSGAVIGGRKADGDIVMRNPIFGVGDITFETDSYMMPEEWNGTAVEIEAFGNVYRGYLESLDVTVRQSEVLKYKLIESR